MKSVLLLVLFLGLVSGLWYKRNFDRREETPTEEPDTTTTAEEETETTTEAEYTTTDETTTEGSAALASDMGPNCEEFAGLSDEAALEAHCGEDDDCLKSAEDCELRLKCEAFGEIENCGGFGNLEDRVRRLEKLFKKSTGNELLDT